MKRIITRIRSCWELRMEETSSGLLLLLLMGLCGNGGEEGRWKISSPKQETIKIPLKIFGPSLPLRNDGMCEEVCERNLYRVPSQGISQWIPGEDKDTLKQSRKILWKINNRKFILWMSSETSVSSNCFFPFSTRSPFGSLLSFLHPCLLSPFTGLIFSKTDSYLYPI